MKPVDVIVVVLFSVWPILIAQWPNFYLFTFWPIKTGLFLGIIYFINYCYETKRPLCYWKKKFSEKELAEKILMTGSPVPKTKESAIRWLEKVKDIIWPTVLTDCLNNWSSGSIADGIIEISLKILQKNNIDEDELDNFLDIFYTNKVSSTKLIDLLIHFILSNYSYKIKIKTMNILSINFLYWNITEKNRIIIKTIKVKNMFIIDKIIQLIEENNLYKDKNIMKVLEDKMEAIKDQNDKESVNLKEKIKNLLNSKSYPQMGKEVTAKYLEPSLAAGALL